MDKSVKKRRQLGYSIALGILTGVGMALVFAAGFFFRDIVRHNSAFAAPIGRDEVGGYPLLDEVQTLLERHYLRQLPDYTTRQYAAIRGMLTTLEDRYTFFIDPPVAQSESDVLAGTYGGIGVQIRRNEQGAFVLYPFPESPAEKAGVEDGDTLTEINGNYIEANIHQDVLEQALRGEVKDGNGVEITFIKPNGEVLTAFILFDVINVPSVIWRVLNEDEQLGYVQIVRFTSRTPEELSVALAELMQERVGALVLDLRNNSGGLLQESIAVASQFLEADTVVLYEFVKDAEKVFQAQPGGLAEAIPLVVLVNQGTASAAELVAGAIQSHNRGALIGQPTFGKGTVQQIFRLSDQSSLHITSAEWLTPDRRTLEGLGLQPDINMIPDPDGRDIELGEAIRYLQQSL
jgi:carboxyl-terminal processing protease